GRFGSAWQHPVEFVVRRQLQKNALGDPAAWNNDSRARKPWASEHHARAERKARGHTIGLAGNACDDAESSFADFNGIAYMNPETEQQLVGYGNRILSQMSSSGVQLEPCVKGVLHEITRL